ncbi:hypothetical protein HPB50_026102 [Hyalomma asiaticum]|uniref:Uncharacterized protein n=1 Tax=Hyalomma asiaticum TaxID=266040 RepID=A0ACB7TUR4_HYAAI|nr:hypothetical protein HPB50_026102 [Hyalomma asiaticum]
MLLDMIPATASTVVLHVSTNDLASCSGRVAFKRYRKLLDHIATRPDINRVYASLILPTTANSRSNRSKAFFRRCNQESCIFNHLLRAFCRQSKLVHFVDHGFEWLPPARVLAADGLHPSYDDTALIACQIKRLCFNISPDMTASSWRECPSNQPPLANSNTSRDQAPPRRSSAVLTPSHTVPSETLPAANDQASGTPDAAPHVPGAPERPSGTNASDALAGNAAPADAPPASAPPPGSRAREARPPGSTVRGASSSAAAPPKLTIPVTSAPSGPASGLHASACYASGNRSSGIEDSGSRGSTSQPSGSRDCSSGESSPHSSAIHGSNAPISRTRVSSIDAPSGSAAPASTEMHRYNLRKKYSETVRKPSN